MRQQCATVLFCVLLHFFSAEGVSSGLRRQARVQRVLQAHAAIKRKDGKELKVEPEELTPQTGHSSMNPQTAKADPALPAKYTDHSVVLMDDSFDSTEKMVADWILPKNVDSEQMGFEQTVGQRPNLWFAGHFVGKEPLRSKQTYEWPFTVIAELDRSHKCSDHFIMLSTKKNVKFSWGYEPQVVKIVQNCDTKTIYSNNMDGTPHEAKAAASTVLGAYMWEVVVTDLTITFKDNRGAPVVVPNHLGKEPVYVYAGADQDIPNEKSRFYQIRLQAPPKAKSLGADVIMGDDFGFLNDTRPREWEHDLDETHQVDYGCGGLSGNPSLRFSGPKREATSKSLDFHRGGVIESCVRFGSKAADEERGMTGGDDRHTCSAMNSRDGMALQASTDGKIFTTVLRLVNGQFPELQSSNFTCLRTIISSKAYSQFMSSTLWLRWKQISDTDNDVRALYKSHEARGNWALGRVRAIGAPEPAKKLIMEDDMFKQAPEKWTYPASTSKCPQWGVSPEKRGFWMGGMKLDGCGMARTMQMFQGQIVLETTVAKVSKCSSQIIVISPNKELIFNKNGMKDSIIFGWDCNEKFILGPKQEKDKDGNIPAAETARTTCAQKTHYNVEIKVENGAVLMLDDRCAPISIPIGPNPKKPFYVFMGSSNPIPESTATFSKMKIYQQVDVMANGFGNIFEISMVKDELAANDHIDETQFVKSIVHIDARHGNASLKITPTTGFEKNLGAKQGQWFSGSMGGSTPIRVIKPFAYPFAIRGQVLKDSKCSNQFVMLTTNPEATWSWGEQDDVLKIGWNCDTKFIYGSDAKTTVTAPCKKLGVYDMDIKIFEGMISFTDDVCGTLSTLNSLGAVAPDAELYVYYGADTDVSEEKSTWKKIEITGPERPPVVKNRRVLMQDDFDFKKEIYQPMWSMDDTTGISDQVCGAVKENALHFGNSGARVATSKPVDASKGARLEFAIKFGGSSMQCGKFTDGDDGVEVQYSVDDGYTWKKIVRYRSKTFPEFSKRFTSITNVVVDDQQFSEALTHRTMFRWTSISKKNRPCCGHWAIDDVRIVSLETEGDLVVDDIFKSINTTAWTYPEADSGSTCHVGLENRMLEFTGQCQTDSKTLKSNRPLNGAAGVVIETELKKDWKCANHVLAISTLHTVELAPGPQEHVVKMGWDCNKKYIQTPTGLVQTDCEEQRTYKTLIRVEDGFVHFEDDACAPLKMKIPESISESLFHVFVGSLSDIARGSRKSTTKYTLVKIEQNVPNPYDTFTSPIIVDDFSERREKNWLYPNATQQNGACRFRMDEQLGEVMFSGNCTESDPMRMKDSLPIPFNIVADIDKTNECSNQYVMISPKRNVNAGTKDNVVRMGWNCDEKYLSASGAASNKNKNNSTAAAPATANITAVDTTYEKYHCPNTGKSKLTIQVQHGVITFRDSNCNVLVVKNPFKEGTELYLYIGAATEEMYESSFSLVTVEGPAQPPKLEEGVVMYDGFDYRENIYAPMWTMGETTGRPDQECGSKSGNSLRFFNPGVRVATTKALDIRYGADLKFYIHMGGSDGPACKKMSLTFDKDGVKTQDGIRVQFTHDSIATGKNSGGGDDSVLTVEGGEGEDLLKRSATRHTTTNLTDQNTGVVWYDLADYTVIKYGTTMGDDWIKIIIPMDYDTNMAAIGKNVRLRWIQRNQDAQACCDHWALDEVEVKAHRAPSRPKGLLPNYLLRDVFTSPRYGANPIFWNMFQTTGRSGTLPEKESCDVRPIKERGEESKVLRFDSEGPRIATTETLNFVKGDGASVTFFLSFSPSGVDEKRINLTDTVPVVLEFSTDQGVAWQMLAEYSPANYPEAMHGCARVRTEVDSKNNTKAFQDAVQFRWSQSTSLINPLTGSGPARLAWALDGVEIRTGDLRIGFEDYELDLADQHKWCYQPEDTIAPYNYTYNQAGHLAFGGNARGKGTVRTHMSFNAPMVVEADIERDQECSNHYIVVTPKKYFVWSWAPEEDDIKFVWHCNEKMIIHGKPGNSEAVHATNSDCKVRGVLKARVDIKKDGTVTFTDNKCETVSIQVDPSIVQDFYIYVGAAQPVTSYDMEKLEVLPHASAQEKRQRCGKIKCGDDVHQPVCGSDGKTYDSFCFLSIATCMDNVQKVSTGECVPLEKMSPSVFKDIMITGRGSFVERKDNGEKSCPFKQDCEVSEFSDWSNCSTTCGEGVNSRNRTILTTPKNTGKLCPSLSETKVCNLRKCDCSVTEWSEYGSCDVPCGGGKSYRSRNVVLEPLEDGLQCPALNESRSCNSKPCARVGLPVVPARVKKMLHEQKAELFTQIDKSMGGWCYQDAGDIAPYSYGYTGNMGGVWFSGDGTNQTSMRSHQSFGTDNHDLFVQAEISKNSECSNHYIILTSQPYYKFTWNSEPSTFKMVWNCDQKMIIYPGGKKSTKCGELKNYNLGVRIEKNRVKFEDDTCEKLIAPMGPGGARDLFLYIGANYAEKEAAGAEEKGVAMMKEEEKEKKKKGSPEDVVKATSLLEMKEMSTRVVRTARLRHQRNLRMRSVSELTDAADAANKADAAAFDRNGGCGNSNIPWNQVECDLDSGAVVLKDGDKHKCLTSSDMLLIGNDGTEFFDIDKIVEKVKECKERDDCVGIQKILMASKRPGRFSLRSGYDMTTPDRSIKKNKRGDYADFCPKVSAAEIIKVTEEDVEVQEGKAGDDEDEAAEEDEPNDDRRPVPGWIKATKNSVDKLPPSQEDVKYEYRFKKGNAWYISPPTSRVWDWDSFNTVTGTWKYGDEDGNNVRSFCCW